MVNKSIMKQIEVVAAIIRKGDKIFATQRGYGEWQDWWEFPGGKMEAGETPEETMHCYLCSLVTEALHLNEHEAAKWLGKDELDSVKWLPADVKVVEVLMNKML